MALTVDFVAEHNLDPAAITPEDPNKMIYMIAGYHQLHCAVRDIDGPHVPVAPLTLT